MAPEEEDQSRKLAIRDYLSDFVLEIKSIHFMCTSTVGSLFPVSRKQEFVCQTLIEIVCNCVEINC